MSTEATSSDISLDDEREDESFLSASLTISQANHTIHNESNDYLAEGEGVIERATQQCKPVILVQIDGTLRGVWLLTQIDNWDNEKERLVFLCDYSLIIIKYDFIGLKLIEYKRYLMPSFDAIIIGELKYPETSLIPSRNQLGVRLTIRGQQQLEFLQKWNPWSKSIPWLTMTSHPLLINSSHSNRTNYDINDFNCSLIQALTQNSNESDGNICQVLYKPIIIENYANLVSAVHNITNLGFFKSRGKFSF